MKLKESIRMFDACNLYSTMLASTRSFSPISTSKTHKQMNQILTLTYSQLGPKERHYATYVYKSIACLHSRMYKLNIQKCICLYNYLLSFEPSSPMNMNP